MSEGWQFIDHCCRTCMGRIARRGGVFRCSGCGSEATKHTLLCACGISVAGLQEKRRLPRSGGKPGKIEMVEVIPPKPAGFRCGRNPHRTVGMPTEIIIFLDGQPYSPGDDV